jgi:hypothetical protein
VTYKELLALPQAVEPKAPPVGNPYAVQMHDRSYVILYKGKPAWLFGQDRWHTRAAADAAAEGAYWRLMRLRIVKRKRGDE